MRPLDFFTLLLAGDWAGSARASLEQHQSAGLGRAESRRCTLMKADGHDVEAALGDGEEDEEEEEERAVMQREDGVVSQAAEVGW